MNTMQYYRTQCWTLISKSKLGKLFAMSHEVIRVSDFGFFECRFDPNRRTTTHRSNRSSYANHTASNTGIIVAERGALWIGTGKLSWWGRGGGGSFCHTGLDSEEGGPRPPPDFGISPECLIGSVESGTMGVMSDA